MHNLEVLTPDSVAKEWVLRSREWGYQSWGVHHPLHGYIWIHLLLLVSSSHLKFLLQDSTQSFGMNYTPVAIAAFKATAITTVSFCCTFQISISISQYRNVTRRFTWWGDRALSLRGLSPQSLYLSKAQHIPIYIELGRGFSRDALVKPSFSLSLCSKQLFLANHFSQAMTYIYLLVS